VNSISKFVRPVSGYDTLSTKNSGRHFSKPTLTKENIFGLPCGKPIKTCLESITCLEKCSTIIFYMKVKNRYSFVRDMYL
jgi:hypothetical protein